jgi:DeoR/GlpR family transcriptional regulator of sugar metabolism
MEKRRQGIMELVERHGACSYEGLAEKFGVSTMTIRRDIEGLAREKLLVKTLRGTQKLKSASFLYESSLETRLAENLTEKRAIADAALPLIEGLTSLFLDGSTTCWEFAKVLTARATGLTIITNSALIAMEVGRNRALRVVCFGGDYDPDSLAFIGSTSEEAAGKYYVDMAFFSTKGFIPDEGTFESSAANFRIKQIIARQAKRNVLLVDYTKFGQRSLCKVLDISQIHTVVTDTRTPASTLHLLRESGREVLMSAGSEKK